MIVPIAFEAHGNETTRVRSESFAVEVVEVEPALGVTLDVAGRRSPVSCASSSHGATLPSWSRPRDDQLVALAPRRATAVRVSMKLSVVMFVPKTTSSGEQPRKRPRRRSRALEDRADAVARLVRRADVRARLAQRARDRLADLVGDLRAAGRVEEDEVALQRGEPAADGG